MKPIKIFLSLLILLGVSSFAYAEHTAPVYDVDSMSSASNEGLAQPDPSTTKTASASTAPLITTSTPAPAASPAVPLSTEQRLARLEQQLENSQQNDTTNRLASMQTEVQSLRAQVEELTHQLQEERALHAGSAKQLSAASEPTMSPQPRESDEDTVSLKVPHAKTVSENKIESQNAKTASGSHAPVLKNTAKKSPSHEKNPASAEQPNAAEEQAAYQTAYNMIKNKKYNDAIGTLQKMLVKYPSGQFAANAHYWLGELYSLTGENAQAASEFSTVIKRYPTNPRVADSEFKLGLIYATELKWPEAKTSFNKIVHKYPGSPSARLAMEQLKQLKQAGH